ncbi:nif11-like leader peptide domain protein [Synechococcus sp. BIOS-E4-1]|uniref:Nif11-like leader peptide family natural product precursor n=1 Tax=Synechococcus sp. BIOS-E4-1 TaxID=1400864 RepID=UPI0016492D57|nr:Nif11-like leader peptide family natural product precursor [Synechococcus sp. BIOS-E4-1]QNI54381.1 nif11-like leader peptide domain protein [Synechococcus sp. BIOS-E4-1]
MSLEQLKNFIAKAKGDSNLQEKLIAAADSDAVLVIAKEAGFMISADDLKNAQSEISEEELEGVTGGTNIRSLAACPCILRWTHK